MVNKRLLFLQFPDWDSVDLTLVFQQNERLSDKFAAMLVETTAESIDLIINLTYN